MTTIHRLLDDAFAGIPLSPDVQDLKEEMRANLGARAAELEAAGATPDAAAQRAFDELGDLSELVAGLGGRGSGGGTSPAEPSRPDWAEWERHRVRPRPAFAVRTTLLSVLAGLAVLVILAILAGFPDSYASLAPAVMPALVVAAILLPVAIGVIVADALHQETASHYPMPTRRAVAF